MEPMYITLTEEYADQCFEEFSNPEGFHQVVIKTSDPTRYLVRRDTPSDEYTGASIDMLKSHMERGDIVYSIWANEPEPEFQPEGFFGSLRYYWWVEQDEMVLETRSLGTNASFVGVLRSDD